LEEGHAPIEIDPQTLATRGSYVLGSDGNFTAHPKTDPRSGEIIGFANYPDGKFNAWDSGDGIAIDLCEQAEPVFPRTDGSMDKTEPNHTFLTR